MPSTSEHTGDRRDPGPAAHDIQRAILTTRDGLPHAMNGRPERPSDPRAQQIRKHMQQGLAAPVRHLLTVSACDLADGVPLATVLAPYRQMIAYLELCADPTAPRDLSVLLRAETRAQGRLDLAQLKMLTAPNDRDVLADVAKASAEYETAHDAVRRHVEARLMIVAGSTRRPMEVAR
jgi:hypothetical protein